MTKRFIAFWFICSAYAMLLTHSIVPHHHHATDHEMHQHHDSGQHSHNDEKPVQDISHLFSHFIHAADGFILTKNQNINHVYFPLIAILPAYFPIDNIFIPPIKPKPNAINVFYLSPHSNPSGLRAPPAFII